MSAATPPKTQPPATAEAPFALDEADDLLLVNRALDGDTRAFAVLVRRYSRVLRTYASRILGAFGGSDDVVQEALITAWQQLATLEDRSAVRGWMVRITTRKAFDFVRSARSHDSVEALEAAISRPEDGPEAAGESLSLNAALTDAVSALPWQQRQVWQLREFADLSYQEIASELDLPLSTVRGLLARARRTLMREMGDWR